MNEYAEHFEQLFKGLERAHGRYVIDHAESTSSKVEIKTKVVLKKVVQEDFLEHFKGTRGVQIVPINDDNCCFFGCLDIDDYSIDHKAVAKNIKARELPLVYCSTKSGGGRVFIFLREPAQAAQIQKKLKHFASLLGFGDAEIFPKQKQIYASQGDIGNRIGLPYFGEFKDGKRHVSNEVCYDPTGTKLTLPQFIDYAFKMQMTKDKFDRILITIPEILQAGPPCLNFLLQRRVTTNRNDVLFNTGLYCMKAYADSWKQKLIEYNNKFFVSPLSQNEVDSVINSLEKSKGKYKYNCQHPALKEFCNSQLCRTRKHGIGSGMGLPISGSLQKLDCDPPIWFITMDDGSRLQLTTDQLLEQKKFQKAVAEKLHVIPYTMKVSEWESSLQPLFESVEVLPAPVEASAKGRFRYILADYCQSSSQARRTEDLLNNRVLTRKNKHYFTLEGLFGYLDRKGYYDMKKNEIVVALKEMGCACKTTRIASTTKSVWSVEKFDPRYVPMTNEEIEEELVTGEEEVFG